MTTALDIDLATLVGDMPAIPCEHSAHDNPDYRYVHSEEPASHYIIAGCRHCAMPEHTYAACPGLVTYIMMNGRMGCRDCRSVGPAADFARVAGPVIS